MNLFKKLNAITILSFYFLIYILFEQIRLQKIIFLILLKNVFLIFLIKSTMPICNTSYKYYKIIDNNDTKLYSYRIESLISNFPNSYT